MDERRDEFGPCLNHFCLTQDLDIPRCIHLLEIRCSLWCLNCVLEMASLPVLFKHVVWAADWGEVSQGLRL